ncbi:MAG: imidazolonepropionase [Bacteroidota bacterium]
MTHYKLIGTFHQLLPLANLPLKGALKDQQLELISDAGILLKNNKIHAVGKFEEMYTRAKALKAEIIEIEQGGVVLPAFVDCHTHICFGGSRANDYALRNAGATYLDIAKSGGGIWDTVQKTRLSTHDELVAGIVARANRHLRQGVTTIEVKSGYGLSVAEELKMLRAIQQARSSTVVDLIPTCLAAHIFPKDYDGTVADYLREMTHTLFPILQQEQLANRVDAFIEEEAFTPTAIEPYFAKAKLMDFAITVHADQFSPGGSKVAVDFEAISADHLEASGAVEIERLAKSNVVAVALPGATIGLGCPFTPARKILDAGGALAIASDWNPGSAPMGDLLTQAAILGTFQKLSNAEVLAGLTFRAAAALQLSDRGSLQRGNVADFCIFPTTHFNEILYQQGQLKPSQVWKNGQLAT